MIFFKPKAKQTQLNQIIACLNNSTRTYLKRKSCKEYKYLLIRKYASGSYLISLVENNLVDECYNLSDEEKNADDWVILSVKDLY